MSHTQIPSAVLSQLRSAVSAGDVIEQAEQLEPFVHDFRNLFSGRTPLVVLPDSTVEVASVVRICAEHRVGIVPHCGNTSYCGVATPDASGSQIVLALKRMRRIRKVEPLDYAITVESGCVLADVQAAADSARKARARSAGTCPRTPVAPRSCATG